MEQDFEFFMMRSLDVACLFTNIPLEKTIDICANTLFENNERVEGLSKIEFKELLSLARKEPHFILIESSTSKSMESLWVHLRSLLVHRMLFLYTFKRIGYKNVRQYYQRYVYDVFDLFTSPEHLEAFQNFLNG